MRAFLFGWSCPIRSPERDEIRLGEAVDVPRISASRGSLKPRQPVALSFAVLQATARRSTRFDPGKKPESISFSPRRSQASRDPAQIVRIERFFFHLLPNRLDAVRARRAQQARPRPVMSRIIQPGQRGSIAGHDMRKQFGHDRKAHGTVGEYGERKALPDRADCERLERTDVAPMEEGAFG